MHPYLPPTKEDSRDMLQVIGLESVDELFSDIPEAFRLNRELDLEEGKSESEIRTLLKSMANNNQSINEKVSFLGGGAYNRYIPALIKHLAMRQEFFTAYTPYQPEISQGTLQVIFEYQSMICELTGMDVSNASLYDGGTALAEAVFLAKHGNKKKDVIVSETVNPQYRQVIKTYAQFNGLNYIEIPAKNGVTDLDLLKEAFSTETSSVMIQTPNFYGIVEKGPEVKAIMSQSKNKAMFIVAADPISLAVLEAPGNYGADIVAGEGQSLGNPLQYGGPYLGFIATKKANMRRMPGRIVGQTLDQDGERAYVLTLQAREQHIRREKAMSNITSNQGLNALMATIYLATMGKEGLKEVALQSLSKAHYLADRLNGIDGIDFPYQHRFFSEFVIKTQVNAYVLSQILLDKGYYAGLVLSEHELLISVTEKVRKEEMDAFVKEVEGLL